MATDQLEQSKVTIESKEPRVSTLPESLTDSYRKKMGELLELTKEQETRLKSWLKSRIREWIDDTAELHQRLTDDNDLVEGVVMETDFPFEGCSNVHVPVTEMYMEVYKSVEKRSILGADILWYGETDLDELQDMLADVEDMMNYKARQEWNIEHCLSNVFWTTNRDGLGIIEVTWLEQYEKTNDILLITNEQEFLMEFPSPEEAGLSEEEFMEFWQAAMQATEEFPLEIPISFEKQTYSGCKGEVVELIDFVTFPATVPDIKDTICRGYGKRYTTRGGAIRDKGKDKVFYKKATDSILSKSGKSTSLNTFRQNQDDIEGLGRTNTKDQYELFSLCVKGRLDGEDSEERKFYITYSYDHDVLLQVTDFVYRLDNYALFKINERPNRMIGRSIPQKVRDMNDEIDTQHNQRINSRTIGTVPVFKAQLGMKKELDPMLRENKWAPGRIFWLSNFDAFDQFKVQPTDLGESMSEEENDFKILDLYLGSAVSLLSGSSAPSDPNAPGNKTAMMIQQSNLRMDDPLSELRKGVSELGDICLSHLYQFGPPIIKWQAERMSQQPGMRPEPKTIHKKFLRKGIHMKMSGVTVTQNPEAEMAKALQLQQVLMQEPMYMQNAQLRIEGLRSALRAGRVPNRQRLLPSAEEIQAQEIQLRKQAMMQMQQEQQMANQAQAEEALKQRMEGARRNLEIKSLAKKTAESNLQAPEAISPGPSMNGEQPQ